MIVAKTVIPNQFWILREDDRKIGNIEAVPDGFQVKINDEISKYKSIGTIKQKIQFDFESTAKLRTRPTGNDVNGYPTTSRPYNPIYDVKHRVPLWTRETRSKSWYAAGWYRIKQGRSWVAIECPKLIMLERYEYRGPFYSEEQARDKSIS